MDNTTRVIKHFGELDINTVFYPNSTTNQAWVKRSDWMADRPGVPDPDTVWRTTTMVCVGQPIPEPQSGKVVSERPQQYGLDFTEADWRLITRALATHIEYGAEKDMSPAYQLAECIREMVNEQWPTQPDDLANHDS